MPNHLSETRHSMKRLTVWSDCGGYLKSLFWFHLHLGYTSPINNISHCANLCSFLINNKQINTKIMNASFTFIAIIWMLEKLFVVPS